MSPAARLSREIDMTKGTAVTHICKFAMISGIAALVTACDTMGSGSLEGEADTFDDEQSFGTEPSDPNQ
jgi:hypothetical protein